MTRTLTLCTASIVVQLAVACAAVFTPTTPQNQKQMAALIVLGSMIVSPALLIASARDED